MMIFTWGAFLSVASLVAAQDLRPYDKTAENLFNLHDVDKDGEFSLQELQLSFAAYDANFDGVVSRVEYTTYSAHLNPSLFVLTHALYDRFDRDANGILTKYDYDELYKMWDENENNVVSKPEFVHWWTETLTALDHLRNPNATFPPTTSHTT